MLLLLEESHFITVVFHDSVSLGYEFLEKKKRDAFEFKVFGLRYVFVEMSVGRNN